VTSSTVPVVGVPAAPGPAAGPAPGPAAEPEDEDDALSVDGVAAGLLAVGDASGSVPSAVVSGENQRMPMSIAARKSAAAAAVAASLDRLPGPPRPRERPERPTCAARAALRCPVVAGRA
jgi:hypothetical protein